MSYINRPGRGVRLRDKPAYTPTAAAFCQSGAAHHWICPTPDGPLAHSHCKKCGAERDFKNAMDDVLSHNDAGLVLSSLGRVAWS